MTHPIFPFFKLLKKQLTQFHCETIFVDNYCLPLLFPPVLPSVHKFDLDFEQDPLKHCVRVDLCFLFLFFFQSKTVTITFNVAQLMKYSFGYLRALT